MTLHDISLGVTRSAGSSHQSRTCIPSAADSPKRSPDGRLLGPLLENFVLLELLKQASWSETQPRLFYFRTQAGQEIDVVMEDPAGRIVGIEIKAAATLTKRDFAALKDFSESMGDAFHRGIILYMGSEPVSFGKNLHALPVSTLWK